MLVAKTEHWNHYARIRQDLFGFGDTMALSPTTYNDALLIQTTTGAHRAARVAKILANAHLPIVLRHLRVEVWSWSLKGARGKRKLWTLRREGFRLEPDGATVHVFESNDPFYL